MAQHAKSGKGEVVGKKAKLKMVRGAVVSLSKNGGGKKGMSKRSFKK